MPVINQRKNQLKTRNIQFILTKMKLFGIDIEDLQTYERTATRITKSLVSPRKSRGTGVPKKIKKAVKTADQALDILGL